jgi:hypothetical protein
LKNQFFLLRFHVEKWNIPKDDFGVSCTKLCSLGEKEKKKKEEEMEL